ncbi:MAG: prepilin-type N-terminal cleavage/methylation domain-containing protein [Clostridia bacterium]|nr:prepilin-type N-terminal cleavage/methylation domain-containing protein [Clostridia bacterium]
MFIISKMKCNSEKNINKHVIASDRKGAWQSKKYAFTLSCKSFRSGLDSLLHLWCSKARNPRKPSFAAAHSYGFTLTEVIVVIVIIAALALILIPNMLKMMPDDHNIKYKKAFYTIQEIVADIASECQGQQYDSGSGEWEDAANPERVLSYCYNTSGETPSTRYLADEICDRLSTTSLCNTTANANSNTNIQTTNGMNWRIPSINLTGFSSNTTIYVNVDGTALSSDPNFEDATNINARHEEGTFRIIISPTGKVTAPAAITDETGNELNYLLKNPTDD